MPSGAEPGGCAVFGIVGRNADDVTISDACAACSCAGADATVAGSMRFRCMEITVTVVRPKAITAAAGQNHLDAGRDAGWLVRGAWCLIISSQNEYAIWNLNMCCFKSPAPAHTLPNDVQAPKWGVNW